MTASALFISDLHLCASRPQVTAAFERLLAGPALQAGTLYILGDLFEYWAGDDDLDDPFNARVIAALAACGRLIPVHFMHGNRDFLAGPQFARAAALQLLPDPVIADIAGQRVLLSHGDTLCTDDAAYRQFRAEVRNPQWASRFLALSLAERKRQIESLRRRSEIEKRAKAMAIMDVNQQAVEQFMRDHGCTRLIHGHTHRPGRHNFLVDGQPCERIVLGDWHEQGSYLRCDAQGFVLHGEADPAR